MKKVLLLLANGFEVYEASVFIDIFGWNQEYGTKDIQLFTVGKTKQIRSTFKQQLIADITLEKINPDEFDALAIPGGFGNHGFYEDAYSEEFQELIKKFDAQQKPIASICVAALALGNSGILKGRKATTYNLMGGKRQTQLKEFGVQLVNEPVVTDQNVITSWSPVTAIEVAFRLLEMLTNAENCNYIREIMGFKPE